MAVNQETSGQNSFQIRHALGETTMIAAIIDPLGKHGGHYYYVNSLACALQQAGVEVLVYVTDTTGVSGKEPYKAIVSFYGLYGKAPRLVRGMRFFCGLSRAVLSARRHGAGIVHLHAFHYGLMDVAAVWLPKLFSMKVVITLHDIESFGKTEFRWLRSFMLKGASGYIVHNDYSRNVFVACEKVGNRPIAVIPHGHYIDDFPKNLPRQTARKRLGIPIDKRMFLFFGNSRLEKGLDILIDACGRIKTLPNWILAIAGKMKPDQLAHYRMHIDECDVADRVRIDAKLISDDDAVAYYRAANLVVVPYRRVYESGVTIMSMSLGRAVLVSSLPPLVQSVAEGNAGIIFQRDNVDALAKELEHAAKMDVSELDGIGSIGLANVAARRDWKKIGIQTMQFYTSLICGTTV
jgi:D-inositol-3-phosphate glycosyltransferase